MPKRNSRNRRKRAQPGPSVPVQPAPIPVQPAPIPVRHSARLIAPIPARRHSARLSPTAASVVVPDEPSQHLFIFRQQPSLPIAPQHASNAVVLPVLSQQPTPRRSSRFAVLSQQPTPRRSSRFAARPHIPVTDESKAQDSVAESVPPSLQPEAEQRADDAVSEAVEQCERRRGRAAPNEFIPGYACHNDAYNRNNRNLRKLHLRQKSQTQSVLWSLSFNVAKRSMSDDIQMHCGRYLDLPSNMDLKKLMQLASQMVVSMAVSRLDHGVVTTDEPPHDRRHVLPPSGSAERETLLLSSWARCLPPLFASCPLLAIASERLLWQIYQPSSRTELYRMMGVVGAPPSYEGMDVTDTAPPPLLVDPLMDVRMPPVIGDEEAEEEDEDDDM